MLDGKYLVLGSPTVLSHWHIPEGPLAKGCCVCVAGGWGKGPAWKRAGQSRWSQSDAEMGP